MMELAMRMLGRLVGMMLVVGALLGCAGRHHKLEYGDFYSDRLKKRMEFSILRAPPGGGGDSGELPVFVWLHGIGDDHRSFDRFGISDGLHRAMRDGRLPRVHFIMPNGERGFYFNWADGTHPYEDYILYEVIPRAEATLGVRPSRDRRHLIGISMGGSGAIYMGLRHPEMFASITALSGLIMNREQAAEFMERSIWRHFFDLERVFGDARDLERAAAYNPYDLVGRQDADTRQRIFLAFGKRERAGIQKTTAQFHEYLRKQSIDHRYVVFEGGHDWESWKPLIPQALCYALGRIGEEIEIAPEKERVDEAWAAVAPSGRR